jgi:hypothetical protein
VAADIDGDGRPDIVMMGDERTRLKALLWYKIPADPRQPWPAHRIGPPVHGAISPNGIADIDSDGDLDVLRADTWFENRDGKGTQWLAHANIPFGRKGPYGVCVRTAVADLDGDGKQEIIMVDADIADGKAAILRTTDKGQTWQKQPLPQSFPTAPCIAWRWPILPAMADPTSSSTSRKTSCPKVGRIPDGSSGKIWAAASLPNGSSWTRNWAAMRRWPGTWTPTAISTFVPKNGSLNPGTLTTAECTSTSWKIFG